MKDRLIVLDFDHCVFNTTLFVDVLQKEFKQKFDILEEDFMKYRQAVKDCCYAIDIDTFIKKLPYKNKKELHDVLHRITEKSASFVFKDVVPFINKYKNNFDIIILTHGDKELQSEKIKHSNLPKEVEYNISLETKDKAMERYIKKYKEVHFIDDKAQNIDLVKTAFPGVKTYFITRPEDMPYGYILSKCDCVDNIIKSLDEVRIKM